MVIVVADLAAVAVLLAAAAHQEVGSHAFYFGQ